MIRHYLLKALEAKWVGQPYEYQGKTYTIVAVDSNGCIHIDLPSKYNPTTAVAQATLDRILPPRFGFPTA